MYYFRQILPTNPTCNPWLTENTALMDKSYVFKTSTLLAPHQLVDNSIFPFKEMEIDAIYCKLDISDNPTTVAMSL